MSEPRPDNIDLNACFKQVNRGAMSKGVWVQTMVLLSKCAAFQTSGMPFDDLVDSESGEWLSLLREKRRSGRLDRLGRHQSFQQRRGFGPQRATAPLVSFAMQPDLVGLIDVDVRVPKISGFLNASAGIVEEHQERPITQCHVAVCWEVSKKRVDLIAFQVDRSGRLGAFGRYGFHSLSFGQHFGMMNSEVTIKRA